MTETALAESLAASRLLNAIPSELCKTDTEIAAEDEARQVAKASGAVQGILRDLAHQAGGDRTNGYRFGTYQAKTDYQRQVFEKVQEWADTFPARQKACEGLVLFGTVGTGKDHLAFAAVRKVVMLHGVTAGWRNGRDLMGEVRDRMSEDKSERQFYEGLESPAILVLSDPLPVSGPLTTHQADVLYRVVENRYAAHKLTLVTINVKDDADADQRLGVPTWDRLCDRAWKIECKWPSYRRPAVVLSSTKKA